MKKQWLEGAFACLGAVIGAGFVSGREIMRFFSQYGAYSWGLILLSVGTMVLLCCVSIRYGEGICGSGEVEGCDRQSLKILSRLCLALLLMIIGGAMISAAGHMVALLWPSQWAYSLGAVGTLLLAWRMGKRGIKPLSRVSGVLVVLFVSMMVIMLKVEQPSAVVTIPSAVDGGKLALAALGAVGYGGMNIAIAIGVIQKTGRCCLRQSDRQSALFGLLLIGLLFLSNYLLLKHPELTTEAFPVVKLFRVFGRAGYVLCVILLYLAILTTLTATLSALNGALEAVVCVRWLRLPLMLGVPLLISAIGFAEIVEGLYAPMGIGCILTVFLPALLCRGREKQTRS